MRCPYLTLKIMLGSANTTNGMSLYAVGNCPGTFSHVGGADLARGSMLHGTNMTLDWEE